MGGFDSPITNIKSLLNDRRSKSKKITEKPTKLSPYQFAEQTRVYERDPYVGKKSDRIMVSNLFILMIS